jgi:prepilin-type N-terminal cleavage/methylation domain
MKSFLRISHRGAHVPRPVTGGPRKGFSVVEVIVAMVLLAIAVSSLAALSYSVSRSSIKAAGSSFRNAVLMHEVNRLEAIPYDEITLGSTSTSVTSGPYAHTRVLAVSQAGTNVKLISLVITPVNVNYKPDTVSFSRTKARTTKVLNTILP